MAVKTYLYRAPGLQDADLDPLLAVGANPTVGVPLNGALVPITVDDSHKADLDDAMESLGYAFDSEYTDPAAIIGRRDYGVLTGNPTGTTPGPGDYYYNQSLQMEMKYDSLRSKWLSVETAEFIFGRDGRTNTGQFYRTADGRVMSPSLGWYAVRSGTVISFGYTRKNVDVATFEITANGAAIATLISSSSLGRSITLDGDFTFGQVLGARNQSGGNVTEEVTGWIRVKWRV
jgi:hypothetical protein